jgi:hypothetical protein
VLTNLIYLIEVDAEEPKKIAFYTKIAESEIDRLTAVALLLRTPTGLAH